LSTTTRPWDQPQTNAARRALRAMHDATSVSDLLFLESWEAQELPDIASTLRASQIRRANPQLAAEIRAELRGVLPGLSARPQ
jgi:hypothetical protein